MKKLFPILLLATFISCKTWDDEGKSTFHKACEEEFKEWAGSDAKAKTYCDCLLEKVMVKYPDENDALEHINDLAKDSTLLSCRQVIGK